MLPLLLWLSVSYLVVHGKLSHMLLLATSYIAEYECR